MVALNGFNTNTLAETIPTESINQLTIPPATALRIYEEICWIAPATGPKHVWPQMDAFPTPVTHTESDALSPQNYSTSKEEIAMATIASYGFASDQADAQGSTVTMEQKVAAIAENLRNKLDKDVLALFGGASNSSDYSGANLTLDNWDAARALFDAQNPTLSRVVFVGSVNQIRDLRKAIRSSGNGGLIIGAGLEVFNSLMRSGYKGDWSGVQIYQGNTTEADASNDSGGFVACAPLGSQIGSQYQPYSGLGVALWRPITVEPERQAENLGTKLVGRYMAGVSITADCNVREFISKKAA